VSPATIRETTGMNILCVTSSAPGHMDFGGGGFVVLGQTLENYGHSVAWLSFGAQVERLNKAGCAVEMQPCLEGLCMNPFFEAKDIRSYTNQHQFKINSIREFYHLLVKKRPDVILIDRLLVYGGLVAEQLNIPYIAIGTPGGYWNFYHANQEFNVYPVNNPINEFYIYGQYLKEELNWVRGEITSFWVNSPFLNINFMSREFYPLTDKQKSLSANVYHHQNKLPEKTGKRLGISFGNQGNKEDLLVFLKHALTSTAVQLPIDVFVGNNEIIYQNLSAVYDQTQIVLHQWVDFGDYFSDLSCLAFLGGIGTIWRCIDNGLPMLVIPGNIGDQLFNAKRVHTIGCGICLQECDLESGKICAAITQCLQNDVYTNQNYKLRSFETHSDDLESICERILRI